MKRFLPVVAACIAVGVSPARAAEPGLWDMVKSLVARALGKEKHASAPAESAALQKSAAAAGPVISHQEAVNASLRAVTENYPAVMERGSIFNEEFCARVRRLPAENAELLKNPDWPMELAKKTEADMLRGHYVAPRTLRRTADTRIPDSTAAIGAVGDFHSSAQERLQLPLAALEPSLLPAVPHTNQWTAAEQERFYRTYRERNYGIFGGNGYGFDPYSAYYYTPSACPAPLQSYPVPPELTAQAQNLASQVLSRTGAVRQPVQTMNPARSEAVRNWQEQFGQR